MNEILTSVLEGFDPNAFNMEALEPLIPPLDQTSQHDDALLVFRPLVQLDDSFDYRVHADETSSAVLLSVNAPDGGSLIENRPLLGPQKPKRLPSFLLY
jgi:hypothetical protein